MTETDVIGHLLDIEQQAAELLLDAQAEADRRLAEARNAAEVDFKVQYEKLVAEFEDAYSADSKSVEARHAVVMTEYRDAIGQTKIDSVAFNGLMDKLLFSN